MAKKSDKKSEKIVDMVSQDKDWRGVIDNELRCQEGWHRDWGFLADDSCNIFFYLVTEKPLTKDEKIYLLEEKLKSMSDVKIISTAKQSYRGGTIDFKLDTGKKSINTDLMPQSRRPKAASKAQAHYAEKFGKEFDYNKEPYPNYLGSK
jgi:hypothetical protein